jgi:hemerythrin superfamily protein
VALRQPTERKAAVPRSRTKTTLDAIDMLKQDHDKVEKAFKEFEEMDREDTETCRSLIQTVCEDLKVHTTLEEEVFYPAVREAIDDEDLMNEAAVEHETAKMLIEQLENMGTDDPNYFAKKAKVDLEGLGERMRARKDELAGQIEKTHA